MSAGSQEQTCIEQEHVDLLLGWCPRSPTVWWVVCCVSCKRIFGAKADLGRVVVYFALASNWAPIYSAMCQHGLSYMCPGGSGLVSILPACTNADLGESRAPHSPRPTASCRMGPAPAPMGEQNRPKTESVTLTDGHQHSTESYI